MWHSIIEMSKWAEIHLYLMKLGFWKKEMLSKEGESKLGQVDNEWDACNNIFGFKLIFSFFWFGKNKCFPKKSFPKKIQPDWDNWQQICCFKNCPSFSLNFLTDLPTY